MKNLANLLIVIGVLLVVYAILGRFVGGATIGLGVLRMQASTGLIAANSLMLVAVLIKLSVK